MRVTARTWVLWMGTCAYNAYPSAHLGNLLMMPSKPSMAICTWEALFPVYACLYWSKHTGEGCYYPK